MPDTYFFEDGKPKFFLWIDHQNYITFIKNSQQLKLTDIRKNVPAIVREWWKQEEPSYLTIHILGTDQNKALEHSKNQHSSPSHGTFDKAETTTSSSGRYETDNNVSKEIAIVRYKVDLESKQPRTIGDNCQVLNEQSFLSMMNKSKKNDFWKSVECI